MNDRVNRCIVKLRSVKKNLIIVFFQGDFTLNFDVIHTSNNINDLKVFLADSMRHSESCVITKPATKGYLYEIDP